MGKKRQTKVVITLKKVYRNSAGVTIQPGQYDADDEALHGLAEYLLKNGHAEGSAPLPSETSGTDIPPTE